MTPIVNCSRCGKDMEFDVRVPSLSAPGQVQYFFSCECGHITSHARTQYVISEPPKVNKKGEQEQFVAWATKKTNLSNGRASFSKKRVRAEAHGLVKFV